MSRRSKRQLGIPPATEKVITKRTKTVTKSKKKLDPEQVEVAGQHEEENMQKSDNVAMQQNGEETSNQHEEENMQKSDNVTMQQNGEETSNQHEEENMQQSDNVSMQQNGEETSNQHEEENTQHIEEDISLHNEREEVQPEAPLQQQEEPVQPSTGEDQTQDQNTSKRKTRGPTKMRGVAKHHDDKVEVEFNSLGEHVGKGSITLSSFLGPLVREHVPVLLDDWRHLDDQTKDILWEEIQGRFNLNEEWQKDSVFKQMGCLWRCSKARLVSQIRNTSKRQSLDLKPRNIQSVSAWKNWVKSKTSEDFKVVYL